MNTIYKYTLEQKTSIELPRNAKVLSVQAQSGMPKMWVQLNTEEPTVERNFTVFGTGHDMANYKGSFIGTFQMDWMVFHCFEDE